MNKLYQGDNLAILRNMPDESIDLICTDPPFNTGKDWGAFSDKWEGGLKGYLKFMEPRLEECRRVLKSTGSLYLHCDPTASHYLKVMLDSVFGIGNFRNEIVWCYDKPVLLLAYTKELTTQSYFTQKAIITILICRLFQIKTASINYLKNVCVLMVVFGHLNIVAKNQAVGGLTCLAMFRHH